MAIQIPVLRLSPRHRQSLVAIGIAALSTACHDDSQSRLTVQYVPVGTRPVQAFAAAVLAGQVTKSFVVSATELPSPVLEMETPAEGFAVVQIALGDTPGAIGGGSGAITLRPNSTIAVLVTIDSVNPRTTCGDCLGAKSFVLAAQYQRTLADSIWMVWSATSGAGSITK
jgi:hypothetical protein